MACSASEHFEAIVDPVPCTTENLALKRNGCTARSSPYYKKDKRNYFSQYLNDGAFGNHSKWRSRGDSSPCWFELHFKQKVTFNTIRIYALYRKLTSFPSFTITAGYKEDPAKIIFQGEGFDHINKSIWENKAIQLNESITARYVRVIFQHNTVLIDEIEVFNGTPPMRTPESEPGDARIRVRKNIMPQMLAKKDDMLVWYEHGAHNVFRDDIVVSPDTVDPACRVSAARGETEAFQIIVRNEKRVKNIRLVKNELRGPSVIPSESIRWHKVGYVYVRNPSKFLPHQLGRDTGLGPGWYPDYLHENTPVDAPPGKNQPLWVDVDVPMDAAPGKYEGSLTLLADGDIRIPLKLELSVYNITMPLPRAFKAIGRVKGNVLGDKEASKNFYRHLSKLGFTGVAVFWPPPKIMVTDNLLNFDWTEFDEMAEYCIKELKFDSIHFPFDVFSYHKKIFTQKEIVGEDVRVDTTEYWNRLEQGLMAYGDHMRKKGWTNKFVFYITDEPNAAVIPFTKKVALLKNNHMPEYPLLWVGGFAYPDLEEIVDIWGPSGKWFEIEEYRKQYEKGKKIWTYPNAMWLIDNPPLSCRMLGWAFSKYDISGIFFYSLNAWEPYHPNPYEVTSLGENRNGDNLFFYEDPLGSKKPANSLRIEMLRDGWDDWEYLRQLQELVAKAENIGKGNTEKVVNAKRIIQEAHAMVISYGFARVEDREEIIGRYKRGSDHLVYWEFDHDPAAFAYVHDPDMLMHIRDKAARAIEDLKK